jgi:transcriptional regulator with XRE-family HTH domain
VNKQDPRYEKLQGLLKALRKKQGIRQQELAERLGRVQSYVSKYEGGERNIDLIELIDVAKSIDLDPAVVISELVASLFRIDARLSF